MIPLHNCKRYRINLYLLRDSSNHEDVHQQESKGLKYNNLLEYCLNCRKI